MAASRKPLFSLSGDPNDPHRYDDMLGMTRPVSEKHPPMTMENRAAQFSPFAALTGYGDVIEETARLTEDRIELTEEVRQELNRRLFHLKTQGKSQPTITLTYFVPDTKKEGGSYHTEQVTIKKIDDYLEKLILTDRREIPFSDIIELPDI